MPSLLPSFDVKQLAETLVFYDEVYTVGSRSQQASLVKMIGAEPFLRLCESGKVKIRFSGGSGYGSFTGENDTHIISLFDDRFSASKEEIELFGEALAERLEASPEKAIDNVLAQIHNEHEKAGAEHEISVRAGAYIALGEQAINDPTILTELLKACLTAISPSDRFDDVQLQLPSFVRAAA